MTEPIPPIYADHYLTRPFLLRPERRGMAAAVILDTGWPYDHAAQLDVFEQARQMINESFTRRQIPTPPGGWVLAALHPDEDWRSILSPPIVRQLEEDLLTRPPTAAVFVVFAVDSTP